MDDRKKFIPVIIVVVVIAVLAATYFLLGQKEVQVPDSTGLAVPQVTVQNNPIEGKVPQINPAEQANPFKYKNPLSK
ncbi:MAG: hypothetical protein Q7R65_02675 [bacterium]|nr:hypothetical protein [bacterium]